MGEDQEQSTPPSRKSWWGRVIAVGVLLAGAIGGFAVAWKHYEELPSFADLRLQLGTIILGDASPLTLNSVALISRPTPASSNSQKVIVEAIASKKYLKNCKADLGFGELLTTDDYPHGTPDGDDVQHNGFRRFSFQMDGKELPDNGFLRLRCDDFVTENWTAIQRWPAKAASFGVVIGEHDNHTSSGETHLPCRADPIGWVKAAHPEICKYVTSTSLGSASGNECGYTHLQLRCSTQP